MFFKSLRAKTVLSALIPIALVLVVVAIIGLCAYERAARDVVQQRDAELARISAARLSENLGQYSRVLQRLAAEDDLQSMELARLRAALEGAQNRLYVFDAGVVVYNSEGIALWSQPLAPERRGADFPVKSEFDKVCETLRPVFSDVLRDAISGEDVILVAVPIVSSRGELRGALSGMFKMKYPLLGAIYAEVLQLKVGRSGYAYLVDSNGRVIYHPDGSQVGRNLATTVPVMRATREEIGAILTEDSTGKTIISGFAPVPGMGWALITEERWRDVAGPIRGYSALLLGLLAVGGLLSGTLIFFAIGRILKPIKDLTRGARRIAGGDFDHTIAAKTGDEIQALAQQFNTMASALKESYRDLERRVAERTKELATLNAVAAVVSHSLDLEEVLTDALDKTLEVMEIEAGGIYLLQQDADVLTIAAHKGLSAQFVAEIDNLQVGEGFSGHVVQTGEPLVVRDVSTDPRLTRLVVREGGFHSVAICPLEARGKVLGSLFVITRGYREFSEQDIELLTSIGHQIGIAVENAQLFGQVKQRMQELEALYSAEEELNRAEEELYRRLRLDQVLQALVDVAMDLLQSDKSSLMVWDTRQERLVVGAAHGFSPKRLAQMSWAPGEGIVGRVAVSGEPTVVEDTLTDPRVTKRFTEPEGIRSFMSVPIKIGGQIFGVFNVEYLQPRAFGGDDPRLCLALAQRAALAIENARLYEQAQQAATLEERHRLARELHDSVTQSLYSVTLFAEAARRLVGNGDLERTEGYLGKLGETAQQALKEMRLLVYELRPSGLEEEGLVRALQQRLSAVEQRAGVEAHLLGEGVEEIDLPKAVEEGLYRIAQEALNNALKHAKATSVTVHIRAADAGFVELEVVDNGQGFDPKAAADKGGMGLVGMRERAERLGGTLQIISAPGEGTKVQVKVSGLR